MNRVEYFSNGKQMSVLCPDKHLDDFLAQLKRGCKNAPAASGILVTKEGQGK
jgi:hypothetical protein